MSGGGHIIIRNSIKQALSDPLVHGSLPDQLKAEVDPILAKDTNAWSDSDDCVAFAAFHWAHAHC